RGDARDPVGSVIHGVHAGGHGQQHLRRADVAGGLLAADVLLARLQRHAQPETAGGIPRDADDPSRQVALEPVARREEGGVRAAVAEGDAEALRIADGDVGAPPPGRPATASVRCIASAAAVASSSSDALAISRPVKSDTIVWKLSSASSRPCAISAWYGVYAVYQPGFSSTLRRITGGVTQSW